MKPKINSILIDINDNVCVSTQGIVKNKNNAIYTNGKDIIHLPTDNIPIFHKFACKEIKKNSPVIKYGEIIGYATTNIKIGMHVHNHNMISSGYINQRSEK